MICGENIYCNSYSLCAIGIDYCSLSCPQTKKVIPDPQFGVHIMYIYPIYIYAVNSDACPSPTDLAITD